MKQHHANQVGVEILGQAGNHAGHRIGEVAGAHEGQGQGVHAHHQGFIFVRDLDQVMQAPRQLVVLVAHHFQLVAGQGCRRTLLARQAQQHGEVRKLLEEIRVPSQVAGDFHRR